MVEKASRHRVKQTYIPERGDIAWLTFDPHIGKEQGGRRPAVVISSSYYNERVGLAIVCPITSHKKEYPFEVPVVGEKVQGVILTDHVKSIDWRKRKAHYIEHVRSDSMVSVQDAIAELLYGV